MENILLQCNNCGDVTPRVSGLCHSCVNLLQKEVNRIKPAPKHESLCCPHCEADYNGCKCDD